MTIYHRQRRVVRPWPKPIYGLAQQRRRRRHRQALQLVVLLICTAAVLALLWLVTEPYAGY